jgi:hypothetical protein
MKVRRRVVAVIRREVKRLATIAADRAVHARSVRAAPNFRPLTEGEAAAILGDALLAKLTRLLAGSRI